MTDQRSPAPGTKQIFVSDPVGDAGRVVVRLGAALGAQTRVFNHPSLLWRHAARESPDLVLVFRPDSMDVLERLRNDPSTRHIPMLLASSQIHDPEQLFLALAVADQIIDYPFEEEFLAPWIERGLKHDFGRGTGQEFAEARLREAGISRWTGRVSWVSGNRLRFETDLVLPEGIDVHFEGPLLAALGEQEAVAHVAARSREDVHYNHEVRLTLDLKRPPGSVPLSSLVRGNPEFAAPGKLKILIVSADAHAPAALAQSIDTSRFSVRLVTGLDQLAAQVTHLKPALVVVDPNHPDLAVPMRAGVLVRVAKSGVRVLPLSPPAKAQPWDRLGENCPTVNVPALAKDAGWTELLARWAAPHESDRDPDRVFLRRDHPFSHGRIRIGCTLVSLTEAGGAVEVLYPLGVRARARLDFPSLAAAGVRPLHGRLLRPAKAKERAPMVWMGVGNEEEERRLRFFVHETIIAQRRRELGAVDKA